MTLEQLDVIPCRYHIGKNIADSLLHISASTYSLSSPPCTPIIIFKHNIYPRAGYFRDLAPKAGQAKDDLCCWLPARRKLLYAQTLRPQSARLHNFAKICNTVLRYRIASTEVLLEAAESLTKVSTDCEVCTYHSISQL